MNIQPLSNVAKLRYWYQIGHSFTKLLAHQQAHMVRIFLCINTSIKKRPLQATKAAATRRLSLLNKLDSVE